MAKSKGQANNPLLHANTEHPRKVYDWDEDADQLLPRNFNRPNAITCFSTPDGVAINFGAGVEETLSRVYVDGEFICDGDALFDFLVGFEAGSEPGEPDGGGGLW